MPDYRAKSGPADVVASGTVICFDRNPITVEFGYGPLGPTLGPSLSLTFKFVDEPGQTSLQARVQAQVHGPTTLELTLFNYTNPIGVGTPGPLHFWNVPGAQLFINFRVFSLEAADKTLQFSIYKVKAERPNG